jgi:hypothetical protein
MPVRIRPATPGAPLALIAQLDRAPTFEVGNVRVRVALRAPRRSGRSCCVLLGMSHGSAPAPVRRTGQFATRQLIRAEEKPRSLYTVRVDYVVFSYRGLRVRVPSRRHVAGWRNWQTHAQHASLSGHRDTSLRMGGARGIKPVHERTPCQRLPGRSDKVTTRNGNPLTYTLSGGIPLLSSQPGTSGSIVLCSQNVWVQVRLLPPPCAEWW